MSSLFFIQAAVRENPWLQEQLIKILANYGDIEAAVDWVLLLRMPKHRVPDIIETELPKDYIGR